MAMTLRMGGSVLVLGLGALGCKSQCDPDEIFEEEFAASDWEACGDLLIEDHRSDATSCLEQAFADTRPAFVRLSSDTGINYLFLDEDIQLGVLTWGGRAGRMGDLVQLYFPCDFDETLEAFDQYEQFNLSCALPSKELCR